MGDHYDQSGGDARYRADLREREKEAKDKKSLEALDRLNVRAKKGKKNLTNALYGAYTSHPTAQREMSFVEFIENYEREEAGMKPKKKASKKKQKISPDDQAKLNDINRKLTPPNQRGKIGSSFESFLQEEALSEKKKNQMLTDLFAGKTAEQKDFCVVVTYQPVQTDLMVRATSKEDAVTKVYDVLGRGHDTIQPIDIDNDAWEITTKNRRY